MVWVASLQTRDILELRTRWARHLPQNLETLIFTHETFACLVHACKLAVFYTFLHRNHMLLSMVNVSYYSQCFPFFLSYFLYLLRYYSMNSYDSFPYSWVTSDSPSCRVTTWLISYCILTPFMSHFPSYSVMTLFPFYYSCSSKTSIFMSKDSNCL